MEYVSELDDVAVLEVDPSKGIKTGIVSGVSYVGSEGTTRHKYETKSTISSNGIKRLISEIPPEPVVEPEPTTTTP